MSTFVPISETDISIRLDNGQVNSFAIARKSEAQRAWTINRQNINQLPPELRRSFLTGHGGMGTGLDIGLDTYALSENVTAERPFQVGISVAPIVYQAASGDPTNPMGPFITWGAKYFVANARYLHRFDVDTDTWEFTFDFGAGPIVSDLEVYNNKLFVAFGSTRDMATVATVTDNTFTSVTGIQREWMTAGRNKLWASLPGSHQIFSLVGNTDESVSNNWGGPFPVGEPSTHVRDVFALDRFVYVAKEDGLYATDDLGDFRIQIPELRLFSDDANGQGGSVWFGGVLLPTVYGLLYYVDGTKPIRIGPEAIPFNDTTVSGRVTATTVLGQYVYSALTGEDGNLYIMAAREPEPSERPVSHLVWHTLAKLTGYGYGFSMHIIRRPTSGRVILKVGCSTAPSGNPAMLSLELDKRGRPLVQGTGIVTSSGGAPAAWYYLPGVDFGAPSVMKYLRKVEWSARHSTNIENALRRIYAQVSTDGLAGPWASLGNSNKLGVASVSGADTPGRKFWIRLGLYSETGTGNNPAENIYLDEVTIYAAPHVEYIKYLHATLMLVRGARDRGGREIRRSPEAQYEMLTALIDDDASSDPAAKVFILTDPLGQQWDAMLQQLQDEDWVTTPDFGPGIIVSATFKLVRKR